MKLEYIQLGLERSPLLIVDHFLDSTDSILQSATNAFYVKGGSVYPGVRARAPKGYQERFLAKLKTHIEAAFGGTLTPDIELCSFSIVTTNPTNLTLNQQFPHTDNSDPNYLAFVHYLCDESHGGTCFFRQKSTGFERVTADNVDEYNKNLNVEIAAATKASHSSSYPSAKHHAYEKIFVAKNMFNRVIVYSGANLHSGEILRPNDLHESPAIGRLTITGFLRLI